MSQCVIEGNGKSLETSDTLIQVRVVHFSLHFSFAKIVLYPALKTPMRLRRPPPFPRSPVFPLISM